MPKTRPSLKARLRYAFDNSMANGPLALIGWLGLASVVLIIVVALISSLFRLIPDSASPAGTDSPRFITAFWVTMMRAIDPGTVAGDTGRWGYLLAMFTTTIAGIFIVSTLIGVLSSGIEQKLEQLQRGHSQVLETGHTLILGWSSQVYTVVAELVVANQNQRRPTIVILADRDMPAMLEDIKRRVPDLRNTRLVCRSGNALDLADLEIVNPHGAKSIIILEPEGERSAAHVVKAILALTNNPNRRPEPYHIVAEIGDDADLPAARMVGGDETTIIATRDLIARIIVQTARQSGLSMVYTELFDFGGDEIYFHREPNLVRRPFGDALLAYEDSTVIGLMSGGEVTVNPPMDRIIAEDDRVIAIAADDDRITLAPASNHGTGFAPADAVDPGQIIGGGVQPPAPERTLILGWNAISRRILSELNDFVAPGSSAVVVSEVPIPDTDRKRAIELRSLQTEFRIADSTDREVIDELDPTSFDQIIVLPYAEAFDVQQADARTLITLLHLRDIMSKTGKDLRVVTEMLDVRNRELAEVTGADDFIVSSQLAGLILTQVSENRHLAAVFEDFLDPEGSEIYLKPASQFVVLGEPVSIATVTESARRRGHIALGYRLDALNHDASAGYGVVVNPPKTARVTFGPLDQIITLAED